MGGAVSSRAVTDFTLMVEKSSCMFVTGPDVIRTVMHEDVTKEDLGGAMTHNSTSGVAHFITRDDPDALALIRELLRVRRQAGMMVPEPVQAAKTAALAYDAHAAEEKARDGERRESERLKAKLGAVMIERDLLHEKIAVLEPGRPLRRRRRRP